MNSKNFSQRIRALLVGTVAASCAILTVANAGPGVVPGHSANAAPPPAPPDVIVSTYYANSPLGMRPDPLTGAPGAIDTGKAIRKFVDILPSIPGLAPTTNAGTDPFMNAAQGGKYIPLATPGIWPADGADYYHLAVVEYTEQLHSDLAKPTTLRGYVQIEEPGVAPSAATAPFPTSKHIQLYYPGGAPITLPDAAGVQQPVYAYDHPHYLGPTIVATKGVPVRIKYSNLLPPGAATTDAQGVVTRHGDLPIPVDATLAGGALQQNRTEFHLHGGLNPWISDGTPHQWTIPVGDTRYGYVSDLAVTAVGAGYGNAATITIDPPQSLASATATINAATHTVTRLNVVRAGANYPTPPVVTIALPPVVSNTSATARANLGTGAAVGTVASLSITTAGSAFTAAPTVTIAAPPAVVAATAGTPTMGTAANGSGRITAIPVASGGTGYLSAPLVTIGAPPATVAASATAAVSATTLAVTGITVNNTNFGYWTAPAVTISAPAAAQAAAGTAAINATGAVTGISLTGTNLGYYTAPVVTIAAPSPAVQATGTATVSGGAVTAIAVNGTNLGYWTAPTVTIAAPTYTTATATPTVSGTTGAITGMTINNAGSGYTSAPGVTIAAPPTAVDATATPVVSTTTGAITALNVNAANFGYWTAPAITISAPLPAVRALATATITGGAISAVTLTNAATNYGYWTAPTVAAAGGRTAARITALVSGGRVTGFTINSGGAGYTAGALVTIGIPPASTQASATATIANGKITGFTLTGGVNYNSASPPTVTIGTATAGTQATATATIAGGVVTGFSISGGTGYNPAALPAVTIAAPPPVVGATATATATVAGGRVTGFTISGGSNYVTAPLVTISAPTASVTATATATLAAGQVTGFTVAGGTNYLAVPAVTIAAPPASVNATATATLASGRITGFTIAGGTNYTAAPTVTIATAPVAGVQATGTATFSTVTHTVTGITMTNNGSGYATAPAVTIAAPAAPVQATATATIAGGVVTSYTMVSNGLGYFTAPAVTVVQTTQPVRATAVANLGPGGVIGGFTITNAGSGYSTTPAVTVAAPPGAVQATATATLTGGALTGVTVTNPGGGYTATPNVTVDGTGTGATASALIALPVGVSFRQVPDMVGADLPANRPAGYTAPIIGEGTLYYTNDQSERLMWLHDHSSGLTRLNVYMGEASPYLLIDPTIDPGLPIPNTGAGGAGFLQGVVPMEQLPLVLQDKSFVPKDVALQDANWDSKHWGTEGDFWFPHVYETNQDPAMLQTASAAGRWDWGPWFAIVYPSQFALPSGKYGDVTTTPEAFMDTMLVNGTAFPTVTVEPRAYRLRILNAANDRFMNLGLYKSDPMQVAADGRTNTEVLTGPVTGEQPTGAPFAGTGHSPWPTDGRTVPLPSEAGPPMYQIGSEGGLMPFWSQVDAVPVNYDYNRRAATVLNMSQNNDTTQPCYPECHGLYIGPGERADVVVDFAPYADQTLILYNDAPAPNPGFDPRIDYYTNNDPGNAGNYATGGAPNVEIGYAPNTRTIMQIVVGHTQNLAANPIDYVDAAVLNTTTGLWEYNPLALGAGRVVGDVVGTRGAIQDAYFYTQAPPLVGESAYNLAYPAAGYTDQLADMFLASQNEPVFFVTNPGPLTLTGIAVTGATSATAGAVGTGIVNTGANASAGSGTGYSSPPVVVISPPTTCSIPGTQNAPCTQATATALVSGGQVMGFNLTNPGAGYTSVPSVTLISGGALSGIMLSNPGSGYSAASPPAVTLTGGGGSGALASAVVNGAGVVTGITITNVGTRYTSAPTVTIAPPASLAATATAAVTNGTVTGVTVNTGGSYGSAPLVSFSAPPLGTPAVVTATTLGSYCCFYTITNGGSGYTTTPVVTVPDATGVGATSTVTVTNGVVTAVTPLAIGLNYTPGFHATSVTAPAVRQTATGTAVLTGTAVTAINLVNHGSGYLTPPTVTIAGGVQARAIAVLSGGGTGATAQAIASSTMAFVVPGAIPGSGVPTVAGAVAMQLPSGLATLMGCNADQTSCPNASNVVIGRLMNPAIQELFEPFYGRMNSTLGIEMPMQSLQVQTTLPLNFVDAATEIMEPGSRQMWKITHNGVDAHTVHFHLVNVQVLNRVGWDGTVKAPEDTEIGWKETVKMNPLEDIIIVMQAAMPQVPFGLDRSIRPQDASQPLGVNLGFTQFSVAGINGDTPNGLPVPAGAVGVGQPDTVVNQLEDYDNEYVWHCHILGHEENDMMRALVATSQPLAPDAPTSVAVSQAAGTGGAVTVTWVDPTPLSVSFGDPKNELGFRLERALSAAGPWTRVANAPANGTAATDQMLDPVAPGTVVYYRVYGYNAPTAGAVIGGTSTGIGTYSATRTITVH